MSESTQHRIGTKSEIFLNSSIEDGWINILLKWADDHRISEEKVTRDRKKLLRLKSLKMFSVFFHSNKSIGEEPSEHEIVNAYDAFVEEMDEFVRTTNPKAYIPKEISMLTHLEELCISANPIQRLPDEITQLRHLKKLCLCENPQLVLTEKQKEWLRILEKNGAEVQYDDELLLRS